MATLETPDCLACHPVHTPLKISYPITQVKEVCAGCHGEALQLLQARQTKHSALTCAKMASKPWAIACLSGLPWRTA
jgi:predicted CXXCH cytochrome family protein